MVSANIENKDVNVEIEQIKNSYRARKGKYLNKYSMLDPFVYMSEQEKERKIIHWIKWVGLEPVETKKVLEIGCGSGKNLLELIRLGFKPENIIGNELLEDRAELARRILPSATKIICGDASSLNLANNSFDVIIQSTVFTSILGDAFKKRLAERVWELLKPGGGILWYDFIYNNPKNHDVKGIPIKEIKELFPHGSIKVWRVTLPPPIGRVVTKIHPGLYNFFNLFPFFRTHVLCWIEKSN